VTAAPSVSSTPLHDAVAGFLRSDGWPVTVTTTPVPTVETRFAGHGHEWPCTARTFERQGQVVFDSAVPLTVPDPLQASMAVLLIHANWELLTGAFSLAAISGDVRFRTSLLLPDGAGLAPAAVKGLVYANVLTVDRCLPVLVAAASGELGVFEALERLAL
jgi:hypothetical protein